MKFSQMYGAASQCRGCVLTVFVIVFLVVFLDVFLNAEPKRVFCVYTRNAAPKVLTVP